MPFPTFWEDQRLPLAEAHRRAVEAQGPRPTPGVPAGSAWLHSDVWGVPQERKERQPPQTVETRRRARRKLGVRDGEPADPPPSSQPAAAAESVRTRAQSSDEIWASRKAKLLSLLGEEKASVSDLKRELRRLLAYSDSARTSARQEREAFAAEVQQLIAPLVREMERLRARLRKHEGAESKGETVQADAEETDADNDVLRAGKGGDSGGAAAAAATAAAAAAAAGPPAKALVPVTSTVLSADGGAGGGELGELVDAAAELGRREKAAIARKVDAAAATAASGGALEPLLFQLSLGGYDRLGPTRPSLMGSAPLGPCHHFLRHCTRGPTRPGPSQPPRL